MIHWDVEMLDLKNSVIVGSAIFTMLPFIGTIIVPNVTAINICHFLSFKLLKLMTTPQMEFKK